MHRIETGKREKVTLEDLFELAAALDVSPLQLVVPHGDDAELKRVLVWVVGEHDFHADRVKQWVRGVQPLLLPSDYASHDEAAKAQRFYLADTQPRHAWALIAEADKFAGRIRNSLSLLEPEEADDGE